MFILTNPCSLSLHRGEKRRPGFHLPANDPGAGHSHACLCQDWSSALCCGRNRLLVLSSEGSSFWFGRGAGKLSAGHEMDGSSVKVLLFPCINCAMSYFSSLHQRLVVNHLPWMNSTAAVGFGAGFLCVLADCAVCPWQFAGFSADSLCERILDCGCSLLITAGKTHT